MSNAHTNKTEKGPTIPHHRRLNKRRMIKPARLNPEDLEQYELAFKIMAVF
jgi:hypothetical protein